MVSPEIIGLATVVALVGVAAAYSYYTGNEASVDVDDDGNDEISFGGTSMQSSVEYDGEDAGGGTVEDLEPAEVIPEGVRNKEDLTDIKGIGDTRAAELMNDGYTTPEDIYFASDENLKTVDGLGDYTIGQIREDISGVDHEGNSQSSDSTETESSSNETDA